MKALQESVGFTRDYRQERRPSQRQQRRERARLRSPTVGLFYVRRDLQGTVLPTTRWGHRQVTRFDRGKLTWERLPGASRYETGNVGEVLAAAALAGSRYITGMGVDRIIAHAQRLVGRLRDELPRLGYRPLTPPGTGTPIVAFQVPDAEETRRRLEEANVRVSVVGPEQRMRVSVSVFNTDEDIDRLVACARLA